MKWTANLRNLPFVVLVLFIVLTGFSAVQLSRSAATTAEENATPPGSLPALAQPTPPAPPPGPDAGVSASHASPAEAQPVQSAANSGSHVAPPTAQTLDHPERSQPREQRPSKVSPPREPEPFARPPHPLMLGQQVVSPQRGSRPRPLRAVLTPAERELLAHLVHAEAAGEPYEGKVAVAAVVLNRLEHPQFPSTIEGVIFEHLAFEPVAKGTLWKKGASPLAYQAVQDALRGKDPTNGALYFYNPKLVRPDNWIWTRRVVRVIGRHHFAI